MSEPQPDRRRGQQPVDTERRSGHERRVRERLLPSTNEILEHARREQLIAIELVARATTRSSRQVLRDWRRRKLPLTQIGRTVLLPCRHVLAIYFHEGSI